VISDQNTNECKPFARVLTRRDLILYGLVILTPTAPFPVYGIVQQVSGGYAALTYLIAMSAMLLTAASYGRMASAFPQAGSTYIYAQRGLGRHFGFVAGWAMILDYFLIPVESIVYAALTAKRLFAAVPYPIWVIVFAAAITFVNIRGIRVTARASTAMMTVMTGCAVLFAGLAVWFLVNTHGIAALFSLEPLLPGHNFTWKPLIAGSSIAVLSYIGLDAISTLAEDTVHPSRDISSATILVCLIQTAFCFTTVYLSTLVWPDFRNFPQGETAILDVGGLIGGHWMLAIISFVLLVAGLASALTGQAGASRLLFGMGRDGVLSRRIFSHINERHSTPTRSICLIGMVSLLGALTMRFQLAVELLNFGAFVGFILVNLSVIGHFFVRERQRRGIHFIRNLIFPLLGAAVCAYVWSHLTTKALVVGFLWLATGAVYLAFVTRRANLPQHSSSRTGNQGPLGYAISQTDCEPVQFPQPTLRKEDSAPGK
jgi:amino acid transporter